MLKRFRSGITFANVCSFLALLIALGTGSAYAANTVFSTDIVDGEVKTADIHNNAVTTNKLRDDAVDGTKIFDSTVSAADLGFASVASGEIATDAVNGSEVAANAIDSDEILDNSLTLFDLGQDSVNGPEIATGAVTEHGARRQLGHQREDRERQRDGLRHSPAGGRRRDQPERRIRRQRPLSRLRHLRGPGAEVGDAVLFSINTSTSPGDPAAPASGSHRTTWSSKGRPAT